MFFYEKIRGRGAAPIFSAKFNNPWLFLRRAGYTRQLWHVATLFTSSQGQLSPVTVVLPRYRSILPNFDSKRFKHLPYFDASQKPKYFVACRNVNKLSRAQLCFYIKNGLRKRGYPLKKTCQDQKKPTRHGFPGDSPTPSQRCQQSWPA